MSEQTGLVVAALGALAALIAIFANPLGIGHGAWSSKQVGLLVVGLVVLAIGVVIYLRERRNSRRSIY